MTRPTHPNQTAAALFERLFPPDASAPGAVKIGVLDYVEQALVGVDQEFAEHYRLGLAALDQSAQSRFGARFAQCTDEQQDELIAQLERGELSGMSGSVQQAFFALLRRHLQEGLFSDPVYGGNRDKQGWRLLNHPGVWLENSAEEALSAEPVTKGGVIQSLGDLGYALTGSLSQAETIAGYDPQLGTQPPTQAADVVLIGVGAVGAMIAPLLAQAGLRVVGIEAGPWRTKRDYVPDELGVSFYARANMGTKFEQEIPQWRRNADAPTEAATFSLGRMVNGVGGSATHYGAWLRRFHPYHFQLRSHVRERWGEAVLPEGCTLADWPVTYAELEPYYTQLEQEIGISGDETNPFVARSQPLPMPPLDPFRMGELFKQATAEMGLHPHAVPVGVNSQPYAGRPATRNSGWGTGFLSDDDSRWNPALTAVPAALRSGNFEIRSHCRVVRICTDAEGHATGVEYVDATGTLHTQAARTVILCSYTFENVRLLLLSRTEKRPDGLGNATGQVGKHFMTKMFAHVDGDFPHLVFNRHAGSSSQGMILDDFLADSFDSASHGFVGGATLGTENQFLPLQISREALPPDIPTWGAAYKEHIRCWQRWGVVRIQPDTLPYAHNFLDLDPQRRDRSGLGLPVVRVTYDLQPNENRLADWMEGKCEEILLAMGAERTWRGPRFTGVGSSHDLGGCRMGDDPDASVVDGNLEVHDTPGLYVFGGAVFPSCPGNNPTLTIWALCLRAAEGLVKRLQDGEA